MESTGVQVEVWARSNDEYLNTLVFLDEDSRKAVALAGNFMRMLECHLAVERMKNDESFQQDPADAQVQKAVAECTEHPQNIRKYPHSFYLPSQIQTGMVLPICNEREHYYECFC